MSNQTPFILIVEDEPNLAQLLSEYLKASSMDALIIDDGNKVEPWLENNHADLILLDIMLPNKSGFELCKDIRKNSNTPIIMMTAKVEEVDRLIGLELGADDYICKPYSPREVVARVKTVLRRTMQSAETPSNKPMPNLEVKEESNSVVIEGDTIELTQIEFKMFQLLFSHPGRIFSRQYILDNIYSDYRIVSDRTVDSHIKKLRKKLQSGNSKTEIIRSVYGAGYKYEPDIH